VADRPLPCGLTPRLLSREQASTYCGMSASHFDEHVAPAVPPLVMGRRSLWDIRALDRWLDRRSGLGDAIRPVEEWLGGLGSHDRAR
jgi:predicted DNA-binding transcriptional regulator AlpA